MERQRTPQQPLGDLGVIESQAVDGRSDQCLAVAFRLLGRPQLRNDLEALVEPMTRGDPESPLRWTCKSVRRLAQALQAQGHAVSRTLVGHLLNGGLQSARQP